MLTHEIVVTKSFSSYVPERKSTWPRTGRHDFHTSTPVTPIKVPEIKRMDKIEYAKWLGKYDLTDGDLAIMCFVPSEIDLYNSGKLDFNALMPHRFYIIDMVEQRWDQTPYSQDGEPRCIHLQHLKRYAASNANIPIWASPENVFKVPRNKVKNEEVLSLYDDALHRLFPGLYSDGTT